jgi:putative hydrolase of the HAD superfamily
VKGAQGVGLTGVLLARGEAAQPSNGITIASLSDLLPLLSRLQ